MYIININRFYQNLKQYQTDRQLRLIRQFRLFNSSSPPSPLPIDVVSRGRLYAKSRSKDLKTKEALAGFAVSLSHSRVSADVRPFAVAAALLTTVNFEHQTRIQIRADDSSIFSIVFIFVFTVARDFDKLKLCVRVARRIRNSSKLRPMVAGISSSSRIIARETGFSRCKLEVAGWKDARRRSGHSAWPWIAMVEQGKGIPGPSGAFTVSRRRVGAELTRASCLNGWKTGTTISYGATGQESLFLWMDEDLLIIK